MDSAEHVLIEQNRADIEAVQAGNAGILAALVGMMQQPSG